MSMLFLETEWPWLKQWEGKEGGPGWEEGKEGVGYGHPFVTVLSGSSRAWESWGHQGSSQSEGQGKHLPKETMKQQASALTSCLEKPPSYTTTSPPPGMGQRLQPGHCEKQLLGRAAWSPRSPRPVALSSSRATLPSNLSWPWHAGH